VVRLLDPTTRDELRLQLIPLVERANIRIGTPLSMWPADTIEAVIEMVDASGRALKSTSNFSPLVTVNLAPQRVTWKRQGNVMRAVIETPTNVPGPWVIRISVKNRRGELVGRNFLEVARSEQDS
jgi:hypothetical protein